MNSDKLLAIVCGVILCLAAPYCWEQLSGAFKYWTGSAQWSAPITGESETRNTLTATAMTAAGLMLPVALLAIGLNALTGNKSLASVLYYLAIVCLLGFVVAQLVLYNQWGGTGRHLGQTSMSIHAGTTFCVVALFVIYRFFESRSTDSVYRPLFEKQLVVMCLGPFLYRVAYGLWFLVLGHQSDGVWGQQVSLSFGSFLIPMLAIYVGTYIYGSQAIPRTHAVAISAAVLLLIVIGLVGYNGSEVQPALVYQEYSSCGRS